MTELNGKLEFYRRLLDEAMASVLDDRPPFTPLYEMMGYHLGQTGQERVITSRGKAIRPALCFLACEAVGGATQAAVPGAVAVELVHNFSLVHDDIQDGSLLRRHRAAVWAVWGIPHAINVGDGLFALAQLALVGSETEPDLAVRAQRALCRACVELCEGQFLDMSLASNGEVSLNRYRLMIQKKTGALFGCAAEIGAILGGADPDTIGSLANFGRAVGEAFQAYDDVLGVWGADKNTGKPATDLRDRKYGLPTMLAFERANGSELAKLTALHRVETPIDDESVDWMLDLYDRLGVQDAAESFARERIRYARTLLTEPMPTVQSAAMAQFPDLVLPLVRLPGS